MLSVPAVDLHDGSLVPIGVGIRGWATECLSPISGEPLRMLGVKAVAEGMGDLFIFHHTTMPGVGKKTHAVHPARGLEDSLHEPMITTFALSLQDDNTGIPVNAKESARLSRNLGYTAPHRANLSIGA